METYNLNKNKTQTKKEGLVSEETSMEVEMVGVVERGSAGLEEGRVVQSGLPSLEPKKEIKHGKSQGKRTCSRLSRDREARLSGLTFEEMKEEVTLFHTEWKEDIEKDIPPSRLVDLLEYNYEASRNLIRAILGRWSSARRELCRERRELERMREDEGKTASPSLRQSRTSLDSGGGN